MPRERELGRWCKTSPQMLSDPKNGAAPSLLSFLAATLRVARPCSLLSIHDRFVCHP